MKDQKQKKIMLVSAAYVLALATVIFPLLWNSQYNVPSADDWSYGKNAYKALQQGAGLWQVLKISGETVVRHYKSWEGRFMNSLLASLQPGIWGERWYCVVAWMMLGGLILGEVFLFRTLLADREGKERLGWIPVIVPSLIMQILYTPNTVESFYWYTGAVNYTFIFGLSMIYLALFWQLGMDFCAGWGRGIKGVLAVILAMMVGGDNYSTSLSMLMAACVYYFWNFVFARGRFGKIVRRTWYVAATEAASLVVCVLAPGNKARINANFGGEISGNPVMAVLLSLWRSFTNMYSWMNFRILLMLLLIAPFIYLQVKRSGIRFKSPGLFTLLTFGVYASEATATLYVDGTMGGGRAAAVLYYSYHVWLVLNEYWWLGWVTRWLEDRKGHVSMKVENVTGRFLIRYCAAVGGILLLSMVFGDKMELSAYRAYRDYKQGWAETYAKEWNERFAVLHDEAADEVVFEPLSVYPETFLYTDLQDENGYTWVNSSCANYYGKKSITVRESTRD